MKNLTEEKKETEKWKVIDFFAPKIESEKENRYTYKEFYRKYEPDIFNSF